MRMYLYFFAILFLFFSCKKDPSSFGSGRALVPLNYPNAEKVDTVDTYFGTKVADPYRWLENPNSEDTKNWVEKENKLTFAYLNKIPFRNDVKKRLEVLWNYEKFSVPKVKGDFLYFYKNDGLQNQSVLFRQKKDNPKDLEVVLDPNRLSTDGTKSIGMESLSKEGRYLGFGVAEGGSDWRTIQVKDLRTGKFLKDKVEWVKFSDISWAGEGFYYSRYPTPRSDEALSQQNEFHQVFYHKIGTSQTEDRLVFANRGEPKRNFYAQTTSDERFLVISAVESTSGNALYFQDLKNGGIEFKVLRSSFDKDFEVIDNIGDKLLVQTNYKAPKGRLLLVDTKKPEEKNWVELISEGENVLQNATIIGETIVAQYLKNAANELKVFGADGAYIKTIDLPGIGTISGINGDKLTNTLYFSFTSFTRPEGIYQVNLEEATVPTAFKTPSLNFDSEAFETKQIFYYSSDSTRVPMFITHRKGLKLNGNNPTWLYGYGGFNISLTPRFRPETAYFLENGGVFVVANIRGGGEFGERWHKEGTVLKKQNVFDDFIAAAEFLITSKYTSSDKLAIEGGSNGGLLVGACMTQRPELFQVALPSVGVLDMLRFHKFTIGWAWVTDYGSSEDSTQFDYLYRYSPLHNIEPVAYPATLITTADHDDRVVPAHSFKFAATLQEKHTGEAPVLIRIDTKAGHGAGKPTSMRIEEATDKISFVLYNLGHRPEL